MSKYDSYFDMAEAIFKAAEENSLLTLIPYDDPAEMVMGYRSKNEKWCVSFWHLHHYQSDPRYPETHARLHKLTQLWRTQSGE